MTSPADCQWPSAVESFGVTDRFLEYRDIADVVAAPANPKKHDVPELQRSLARFGYIDAISVDERTGRLIAGHGRLEALAAAHAAGLEAPDGIRVDGERWLVPVVRGWASTNDDESAAALVALNQLTIAPGWVDADLAPLLERIAATPLGLEGIGYTNDDLAELLIHVSEHERRPATPVDPDEIPEAPAELISKPGDLWLLGRHRLLVGDATSEADHDRVLGPYAQVDLVLTDPPYGVGVDYGEHMDDTPEAVAELVAAFMPLVLRHSRALITSGVRCAWDYPKPDWLLAWVHPAGSGASPWGFQCLNPVLAYGRDPYLSAGLGSRPDTLVLATDREGVDGHPAIKPVEVWRWLVERGTTAEGQTVLDPFCGAGTTIVVCELTGRVGLGIEMSVRFVDVAAKRWQALTGIKPVLEATGEPYDFLGG